MPAENTLRIALTALAEIKACFYHTRIGEILKPALVITVHCPRIGTPKYSATVLKFVETHIPIRWVVLLLLVEWQTV